MDLYKFYEANKFKFDKNLAYGIYRNRLLSCISKGNYFKVTISFNVLPTKEQGQALSLKIREIKNNNRALQQGLTTNVAQELYIYKSADFNEEFIKVLNECIDAIDSIVSSSIETCPLCGRVMPSNSPFVRLKDTAIQAHDTCINQLINATHQMGKNMEVSTKKSIWTAILICFLCMITVVSIMAACALINIYSYVILLSGWLLFLASRFLFFKFKINLKKPELIVLTVFSLLTVLLSVFFGSSIDMLKQLNDLTLIDVFKNYFFILKNNTNYGIWTVVDLLLSLIFVSLSIFTNFKQLNAGKTGVKKL